MPLLPVGATPAAATSGAVAPPRTFGEAMRSRLGPAPGAPRPLGAQAPSPALRLVEAVERARCRLDAALSEARRGRTFSAGELLALQADAYRAGQTLELASRVVEQGAQSVRQAVNTPV